MDIIPVSFKVERKGILPILTITGVAKDALGIERFLISKVINAIDKAEKELGGKVIEPMGNEEVDIEEGMVAVRSHIIFQYEYELYQAIPIIKEELR